MQPTQVYYNTQSHAAHSLKVYIATQYTKKDVIWGKRQKRPARGWCVAQWQSSAYTHAWTKKPLLKYVAVFVVFRACVRWRSGERKPPHALFQAVRLVTSRKCAFFKKKPKTQKINQRLNNAVEGIKNTTVGGSVFFSDNKKTLSLQKTRPSRKAIWGGNYHLEWGLRSYGQYSP